MLQVLFAPDNQKYCITNKPSCQTEIWQPDHLGRLLLEAQRQKI
jgi:hypothetical protein